MTSANGGNYAGQYPCDGWVDNLEPTPSIGRVLTLVPSYIDNTWRVQTPSNVPIERSQRDLPTPPLSLRVPPSFCFGQRRLRTLPHCKDKLRTGMRDLHTPLRKRHLNVQARSSFCELSSTTFHFFFFFLFSAKDWTVFSLIVSCFGCFAKNGCNVGGNNRNHLS